MPSTIIHAAVPFIATQVGQVSVREGNELELLSDTHWYWWLVRVRSSGKEGFVPAELVELPEERVARLNVQLNIKLPNEPLKSRLGVHKSTKRVRFHVLPAESEDSDDELLTPSSSVEELPVAPAVGLVKTCRDDVQDVRIRGTEDDIGEQLMAQAS